MVDLVLSKYQHVFSPHCFPCFLWYQLGDFLLILRQFYLQIYNNNSFIFVTYMHVQLNGCKIVKINYILYGHLLNAQSLSDFKFFCLKSGFQLSLLSSVCEA